MRGLSLVAASGGHSSSRCAGLSLSRPLLLWSTGSRRAGSVAVAHGPSCSVACGIFPDQGSNPCTLHWQADSQPLRQQGSTKVILFLSPFFTVLWKAVTMRSPHLKGGELCSTSWKVEYLYKLFSIFMHVGFVSSPSSICSFICLYGRMDIYFILNIEANNGLLILSHIWPLGTFSAGFCVPWTYLHDCGCF